MAKKFLRRTWNRYSKLGKGRKSKQVWRSPKGRDNKMREKRKGYSKVVSIGYKKDKKLSDKAKTTKIMVVKNVKDLEKFGKNNSIKVGHVGKKKKIEIAKIMKEKKLHASNLKIGKFLEKIEKEKPIKQTNKKWN